MKQQIKMLVSKEILALEGEITSCTNNISYLYQKADKDNQSAQSLVAFETMNSFKTEKKKLQKRLVKLVALQKEVKKMAGYIVYEDKEGN